MRFKGKRVLVYGLGISGQETCRLLHEEGACVSLYDDDKRFANLFCYEHNPSKNKYDLVIVSPGIKVRGNSLIAHFQRESVVMSELDFGFMFARGKIIAITGTNGKTTVCSLLGKIFQEAGKQTFVCGNIGLPLCSVAKKTTKKSVLVIEVSNFQLELSKKFRPNVACVLNITEDHIDRHGSFEEYKRIKNKIFQNAGFGDTAVVNLDAEETLPLVFPKRRKYFSKNVLNKGAYVKNGYVFCDKKKIMSLSEIPLLGEKNLENVLCCVQIARLFRIKPFTIRKAIASFTPPAHRIEYVGEFGGAKVYDDSKSTNIACTIMAVECFKNQNLILMMGGRNKDNDFAKFFEKKFPLKKLITFGECGKEISSVAEKFGYESTFFEKLAEAVDFVKENMCENDVVLFSPACASFDEFDSYAVRGARFQEMIKGLQ